MFVGQGLAVAALVRARRFPSWLGKVLALTVVLDIIKIPMPMPLGVVPLVIAVAGWVTLGVVAWRLLAQPVPASGEELIAPVPASAG